MADANEVQAALETALADNAESQTAKGSSTEVAEAVSAALGAKEDVSASESETGKGAETAGKEPKTVPYERLSQVVKQKNEISERFTALEEQYKSATAREQELRGRIGDLEQDSQILDAIKNLAKDEKYRAHVIAIDKALQGIDDDIEAAEEKKDQKAVADAEKRFQAKAAELEDLLADQRAENLWNETAEMAKGMLAALPEEYTDEDKVLIGKFWTPRVNWSEIEQRGSEAIPSALNSSFAAVIKEYGTPKGALVTRTTKEVESRIPETKRASSEDVVKGLLEKDWAEKDSDGKFVHSDEEFTGGLTELLRKVHGR